MISKFVNNICGIAMTLSDHASSVMSSQCLYIGMKAYPPHSQEGALIFLAGMCIQDSQQQETVLKNA